MSDFSFGFNDPAFLNALALRGIRTPTQLQQVFVTPLTPGSFGLPGIDASKAVGNAGAQRGGPG